MKVYNVIHDFDLDGGFGDAIPSEDVVACFLDKKDAEDFINKYGNEHVYDAPYADLYCGKISIQEIDVLTHDEYIKTEFIWAGYGCGPDHLTTKQKYNKENAKRFLKCLGYDVDVALRDKYVRFHNISYALEDIDDSYFINLFNKSIDEYKNGVRMYLKLHGVH